MATVIETETPIDSIAPPSSTHDVVGKMSEMRESETGTAQKAPHEDRHGTKAQTLEQSQLLGDRLASRCPHRRPRGGTLHLHVDKAWLSCLVCIG